MVYYDPTDISWFNEPELPLVPDATIRENDATIRPNTPSPSLVQQVQQKVENEVVKDAAKTGIRGKLANPWVKGVGVPIAANVAAPLVGQAIGGTAGERTAGAIGGAGTGYGLGSALLGAKLGGKAGLYGALIGAVLGGTGLGAKIPGVGPALFGQAGGEAPEQVTLDDFEAYGASPTEINRIMGIADRIEDVEGKEASQAYLQSNLATFRDRLVTGELAPAADQIKNDALMAQVIGKALQPYRDEAIKNITAAQQSALKSGMPEVANQYFEMSKATANAYAQQALLAAPTSRLQQTLQDQLNAQAAAGSGSSSGLFGQISALGNQAAL